MSTYTATQQVLRRRASSGTPSQLLSGQIFHNELDQILSIGIGDNGSGVATSIMKIGGVGAFVDFASVQTIAGKKTFSLSPVVPNGVNASDVAAFGQIAAALAGYAPLTGATFTGAVVVPAPPVNDNSQNAATTAFVQNLISAAAQGMQTKPTANGATTAALPANTYANGSSGAGATLTGSANGALPVIDTGYTPATGDIILVKNEAAAANDGLYNVTNAGSASTPYVLTRNVDMNLASEFRGALVPVINGAVNASSIWLCNPTGTVTVGTTAIPFVELNSATQLIATAAGGLSISGNAIQILGYSAVAAGGLLKSNGASGVVAAVSGTDYAAPFTGIDSGTA